MFSYTAMSRFTSQQERLI